MRISDWSSDVCSSDLGEPLVSVDAGLAQAAGLEVGDYLTVGLLGVERRARIANLRRIDWESMGFNYVLIFSPNALQDAPHNRSEELRVGKACVSTCRSRWLPSH